MRSYGIPDKTVRVVAVIYVGFECTVVDGSVTSDWFMIKSGGKKGVHDVKILSHSVVGWGHEEGNSIQEKRDKVEFHRCAGGP